MKNILCVVCIRDFYPLQRQLKSFKQFLPSDYKIIYVVEDWGVSGEIFFNFLTDYIKANYGDLNISIYQSKQWLSDRYNRHPGWIRQQLLKLLVTASQTDTCHVVDCKNFLINPLPLIEESGYHVVIDDQVRSLPPEHQLLAYIDIEQIPLTSAVSPTTPFVMEPPVVKEGMKKWPKGNFLDWWYDYHTEIPSKFTSEFQLYHVWYQKHFTSNPPRYVHRAVTLWPEGFGTSQFWDYQLFPKITDYADRFDLLEKARQQGAYWCALHRVASHEFTEEDKDRWLNWLSLLGHTEDYNKKEFSENPYYPTPSNK